MRFTWDISFTGIQNEFQFVCWQHFNMYPNLKNQMKLPVVAFSYPNYLFNPT